MKFTELNSIKPLYFGYEDIARALGINMGSAKVAAGRYVRIGLLLRLKRNTYVLKERWNASDQAEKFMLANLGQTPSYVSLMTALDYYEITTQVQRGVIESVAVKRTKEIRLAGSMFRYTKIRADLYSDFIREKGFFIATPEKAFMDAFYLMSFGRYAMDLTSIDPGKLNLKEIGRISRKYPLKMQRKLAIHGYPGTA